MASESDKKSQVIVCREEDLSVGGYILPRDPRASHTPTPEEKELLGQMVGAYHKLKELGWRDAIYAPKGPKLLLIEPGSSGTHEGYLDDLGFWIYDGDLWPSRAVLFKLLKGGADGE